MHLTTVDKIVDPKGVRFVHVGVTTIMHKYRDMYMYMYMYNIIVVIIIAPAFSALWTGAWSSYMITVSQIIPRTTWSIRTLRDLHYNILLLILY